MREAKFRVWDVMEKKMYSWKEFLNYNPSVFKEVMSNSTSDILMQYIGLKDNTKWKDLTENEREEWTTEGNLPSQWKGKEIYEGDIVINTNCKYNKDYEGNVIKDIVQGQWLNSVQRKTRKIIGNIHENSEHI